MSKYTIADEDVNIDKLQEAYANSKRLYESSDFSDLDIIFDLACSKIDLFPSINLSNNQTLDGYMARWVKNYHDAKTNPPSTRSSTPKSACSDPAIQTIVKATQELNDEEVSKSEANHNLFMSAENIQGALLEEYIAEEIRPYGFIHCCGNVLRATDFCNTNGSCLLQIKNKNNTENSSSSNIREGTNIKKWYRLGTKTKNGIPCPDYKWEKLNSIINQYATTSLEEPCNMSEEQYICFLEEKAIANPDLIS